MLSQDHWALVLAALVSGLAVLALLRAVYRRSARGQLRARLRDHRRTTRAHRRALATAMRAEARAARLKERASRTKPRRIEEAEAALADARALLKIADDRQQITANLVRRVIFEEFPPSKHARLRKRHLPGDGGDDRPFSFDS